jgi:hypothetical protein
MRSGDAQCCDDPLSIAEFSAINGYSRDSGGAAGPFLFLF